MERSVSAGRVRPLLVTFGIALLSGGLTLLAGAIAWERCLFDTCPDVRKLASYRPGSGLLVVDRNGQPIDDIMPVESEVVSLASLPKHVPEAFIAVEDRRFRSHSGVDWIRVPRAFWTDIRAGKALEGSSTLTMQLARNLFPERIRAQDRTLARKLLESAPPCTSSARFSRTRSWSCISTTSTSATGRGVWRRRLGTISASAPRSSLFLKRPSWPPFPKLLPASIRGATRTTRVRVETWC